MLETGLVVLAESELEDAVEEEEDVVALDVPLDPLLDEVDVTDVVLDVVLVVLNDADEVDEASDEDEEDSFADDSTLLLASVIPTAIPAISATSRMVTTVALTQIRHQDVRGFLGSSQSTVENSLTPVGASSSFSSSSTFLS